jgi:hypothetical protein
VIVLLSREGKFRVLLEFAIVPERVEDLTGFELVNAGSFLQTLLV